MRPIHEVLEFAWPYLLRGDGSAEDLGRVRYICYALEDAERGGKITREENDAAWLVVRQAVSDLHKHSTYLISAAKFAGLVPETYSSRQPEYIAFRDQWLRQLIEKQRASYERQ